MTEHYKQAAAVNNILTSQHYMQPAATGLKPARCIALQHGNLKSFVEDIMMSSDDMDFSHSFQGDGEGPANLAGPGVPAATLTDGLSPSADQLFKKNIHELKGLITCGAYKTNPDSTQAEA